MNLAIRVLRFIRCLQFSMEVFGTLLRGFMGGGFRAED